MTDIRISFRNTGDQGGVFLTPLWFAAHDEGFDVYNPGEAASAGLEALAEDFNVSVINGAVQEFDADAQTGVVVNSSGGPLNPGSRGATVLSVDGTQNAYLSLAAMILPSNDAFIGAEEALKLFDENGAFLGPQTLVFGGDDVLDAGTEVNTELDAAFINQTAPNTGEDENGVVAQHVGFLPAGEGEILGGLTAAGVRIDPVAGDFTREGTQVAEVHINTVSTIEGSDEDDVLIGNSDDNIIHAGDGDDIVNARSGWNEIYGEDGNDRLRGGDGADLLDGGDDDDFLAGLAGDDLLFGQDGDDRIVAGAGNDVVSGGDGADVIDGNAGADSLSGDSGDDRINAGAGDDLIAGGTGDDFLRGGSGEDTFLFFQGDGADVIRDFDLSEDVLALGSDLAEDFEAVLAAAEQGHGRTVLDFGEGDSILLRGVDVADLSEENFSFIELF